jgi:hypothetical protein
MYATRPTLLYTWSYIYIYLTHATRLILIYYSATTTYLLLSYASHVPRIDATRRTYPREVSEDHKT